MFKSELGDAIGFKVKARGVDTDTSLWRIGDTVMHKRRQAEMIP
jgi:hypothetical protein